MDGRYSAVRAADVREELQPGVTGQPEEIRSRSRRSAGIGLAGALALAVVVLDGFDST